MESYTAGPSASTPLNSENRRVLCTEGATIELLRGRLGLDANTFASVLYLDRTAIKAFAELKDVLVVVPDQADAVTRGQADAVAELCRPFAHEVVTVFHPGDRLDIPEDLDTPGSVLAWLRDLPKVSEIGDDMAAPTAVGPAPSANGKDHAPVEDDSVPLGVAEWIAPPDPLVYYGLAGRVVHAILPTTEADPLALLGQFLASFGSVVGRRPHYEVEATRHYTNEFMCFVGESAVSRKGTSADRIKAVWSWIDPDWLRLRVVDGLSSGEGLLNAIRDPSYKKEPIKEKGRVVSYQDVLQDEGVADKRLYVLESEFGGVLRVNEREGNRLSTYVRMLWDSGNCTSLTKSPTRASNAHVSFIGHITEHELRERLHGSDISNGFANRFLWFAVKRSKILPFGGEGFDPQPLIPALKNAVAAARDVDRVIMTHNARVLWESSYNRLTAGAPGVLGQVTNRAAPHTLRLALLYALLDGYGVIDDQHLAAGLCLWDASFRCASHIFGAALEDTQAEKILSALRQRPTGMTRTEISVELFKGNVKAERIKAALVYLLRHDLVTESTEQPEKGRPRTVYRATSGDTSFSSSISYFVRERAERAGETGTGETEKRNETNELNEVSRGCQPPQAFNPIAMGNEGSTKDTKEVRSTGQDDTVWGIPVVVAVSDCGGCLRRECRECNP